MVHIQTRPTCETDSTLLLKGEVCKRLWLLSPSRNTLKVQCVLFIGYSSILTCIPGIVAGGPRQRVSERVDEVEEGPCQDDAVHSGKQLDHYDRIASP